MPSRQPSLQRRGHPSTLKLPVSVGLRYHSPQNFLHMRPRTIHTRKPRGALVEQERQVRPCENNRVHSIALHQPGRDLLQLVTLRRRALSFRRQLDIRAVDDVDLVRPWTHDLDVRKSTEEIRLNDKPRAEDRRTLDSAARYLSAQHIKDRHDRHG